MVPSRPCSDYKIRLLVQRNLLRNGMRTLRDHKTEDVYYNLPKEYITRSCSEDNAHEAMPSATKQTQPIRMYSSRNCGKILSP